MATLSIFVRLIVGDNLALKIIAGKEILTRPIGPFASFFNTTVRAATGRMSFYDEIEIEDMTYHESTTLYTYPCPCGDQFEISLADLRDGEEVAVCPSCSLMIKVIFEVVRINRHFLLIAQKTDLCIRTTFLKETAMGQRRQYLWRQWKSRLEDDD